MPTAALASRPRLRTAQTIHVRQVVEGEGRCEYCTRRATWLLATGTDPDLLPHCGEHAAEALSVCAAVIRQV